MREKYYRQTDTFRCGPIAIMNTLRWAGTSYPFSYFKNELDYDTEANIPPWGTNLDRLIYTLYRWSYHSGLYSLEAIHSQTNLKTLDQILKRGNSVVVRYGWARTNHISFVFDRTPFYYYTANHYDDPKVPRAIRRVSRPSLSQDLRYSKEDSIFIEIKKGKPKGTLKRGKYFGIELFK